MGHRIRSTRGQKPGLPHGTTKQFPVPTYEGHDGRWADEHRPDGGAESLGEADAHRVERGAELWEGQAGLDGDVPEARAIQVHLQVPLSGVLRDFEDGGLRVDHPGERVFERNDLGGSVVDVVGENGVLFDICEGDVLPCVG